MDAFLIAALAGYAVGMFGVIYDAITTEQGIKLGATEGDTNWFTQWLAKSPWRMYTVMPAILTGVSAFLIHYNADLWNGFGYFATLAFGTTVGIAHIVAARNNVKINTALQAAKAKSTTPKA